MQKTNRRASKNALAVNMLGATEAAPMDADLAALLNALEVPGDTPTLEVIEQANAPLVEAATESSSPQTSRRSNCPRSPPRSSKRRSCPRRLL